MKHFKFLTLFLFVASISAQNVINQTYLQVPANKIAEFVDLHEQVTNMSIGEGRTIARSWVYRHWYGSDHSIMISDIYASAEDFVKDDFWGVLNKNIEALPSKGWSTPSGQITKEEMQEVVQKWWGYWNNHTDEVRNVDWENYWYGKEGLNLDTPYVFVVGSYNSSGSIRDMADAFMNGSIKPAVDNGVMLYGGATSHYIGSGTDLQVWTAFENINDLSSNASSSQSNSEEMSKFWALSEGAHADQIYVHVGNTRNAEGKFNRAGPDN